MTDPRVAAEIRRVARRRGEPYKRVKAAFETGLVESNLTNPSGGDADSAGWRQERASLYKDPTNLIASINRFFDEAAQHDAPGKKSYELAADVQRPAAQYRDRYRERAAEAAALAGGSAPPGAPAGGVRATTRTGFDDAGFEQAQQRALVGRLLAQRHGTSGILFKTGLLSTADPDPSEFKTSSTVLRTVMAGGAAPSPKTVTGAIAAAREKLGITEISNNRGRQVDKLEQPFGMIGQPWCGILAGTVLKQAGVKGITSRVASVAAIEEDARAGTGGFRRFLPPSDAQPGDLLITAQGQHVGFVESVHGGVATTIEGNTSSGRVERVRRRLSGMYGVARPRYSR